MLICSSESKSKSSTYKKRWYLACGQIEIQLENFLVYLVLQ